MPLYKDGTKIKDVYYKGTKIKEAYFFGTLVYQIKKALAGVTSTGKDLIIHTTRVIWPTKNTTRNKPNGTTESSTTNLGPTPIGKEITIPTAKETYHDYEIDETTGSLKNYIGYAPNLYQETSVYPGGSMHINKGSGDEFALFEAGSLAWAPIGTYSGNFSWGYVTLDPSAEQSEFDQIADLAYKQLISPESGTWDIRLNSLRISLPSCYSPSHYYKCKLVSIHIKQGSRSGPIIASKTINKEMLNEYYNQYEYFEIPLSSCTFNAVPLNKTDAPYYVGLVFEDVSSYKGLESFNVTVAGTIEGRPRTIKIEEHYDDTMVLEVIKRIDETIQEWEDGTEEVTEYRETIQISLTPASEYDPINGNGIANVKVSEDGDVYELVEFA